MTDNNKQSLTGNLLLCENFSFCVDGSRARHSVDQSAADVRTPGP